MATTTTRRVATVTPVDLSLLALEGDESGTLLLEGDEQSEAELVQLALEGDAVDAVVLLTRRIATATVDAPVEA